MKFFRLFIPVFLLSLLLLSVGCRKRFDFGDGPLVIYPDTVKFDTIFTTFASPSGRVLFKNPSRSGLKIDRIYLEKGPSSEFELIIDGLDTNSVEDYELLPGDSGLIFVKFTSKELDANNLDRIVFEVGDNRQYVVLDAYIRDAIFLGNEILDCNTVWNASKPIVIDGIVRVNPGCFLTILPGTQIYFTPKKDDNFNLISMIDVQGTILVQGQPGNEVVFQQSRLDPSYQELGAQWRGIRIFKTSTGNYIQNALIKNALFGIEVDSISLDFNPKIRLRSTEIRNMAAYGVWGLGFFDAFIPGNGVMIDAQNCLIHNCQQGDFVILGGGNANFYNCTFANYSIDFNRNTTLLGFNNYFADSIAINLKPVEVLFENCIIWGGEEEEVGFDTIGVFNTVNLTFNNCIIKSTLNLNGTGNRMNLDPLFVDPQAGNAGERDYHLDTLSPAINIGKDLSALFSIDIEGNTRDALFDLGCYEYFP